MGTTATRSQDLPRDHGPGQKSPLPPFFKGGIGGDFREGPAKRDFFAIFKIFHFDRPGDESPAFRIKTTFKILFPVAAQRPKFNWI
jgi:hypothetical protein